MKKIKFLAIMVLVFFSAFVYARADDVCKGGSIDFVEVVRCDFSE